MLNDDDAPYGPCCRCGGRDRVRYAVPLPWRAPEAGFGWGCVVCDLGPDGALAMMCTGCAQEFVGMAVEQVAELLTQVCAGDLSQGKRVPIEELSREPFEHDVARHALADAEIAGHG